MGNPLAIRGARLIDGLRPRDIRALRQVEMVFRNGRLVARRGQIVLGGEPDASLPAAS